MKVEIWSDVVCPWCYIGKRRFEQALAAFPHADEVEVVYRSFELDPTAPTEPTETVVQALGRKYGGGPTGEICPAEVTLIKSSHPEANISSATSTAKGAPTAPPTMP